MKHLSNACKSENGELNEVDLSWNRITDLGVQYLVEALISGNCKL